MPMFPLSPARLFLLCEPQLVHPPVDGRPSLQERSFQIGFMVLLSVVVGYIRELSPRAQLADVAHHHGEEDHEAYLERPFLEARAAIHRRMHELGLTE